MSIRGARASKAEASKLSKEQVNLLLKRRQFAKGKDSSWEWLLRRSYEMSQPNRNIFQHQTADGTNKNWQIFDTTLVLATRRFVNKMQQALIPDQVNWFQFVAGDEVDLTLPPDATQQEKDAFKEMEEELKNELQDRTNRFFKFLKRSNFYTVMNEAFYDLAVGTGAIQCNETDDDSNPLVFSSIPMDRIYFCQGAYGTIDSVFRDHYDVPLYNAQTMWPDFKLPENYSSQGQDPYEIKLTLYEMAYYDYQLKRYRYCVVEKSTAEIAFEEKPSESWPFIIFRWYTLPGEDRGRGPVIDAGPSAATINKVMEDEILAADLMSKPVYMGYSDGLFNPDSFQITANSVITVNPIASNGGNWPIAPLPTAGNVEYGAIVLTDLRDMINKIMFSNPLGPVDQGPVLTATEVAIRQNEVLEDAAASFLRLQKELFEPLIKRCLFILQKRGLFESVTIDGKIIDLKFQTPLSLGKGQIDVHQFMLWWQNMVSVMGPQLALTTIDLTTMPHWMADNMNVTLDFIKTSSEIKKAVDDLMKAASAANQATNPQTIEGGLSAGTTEPIAA